MAEDVFQEPASETVRRLAEMVADERERRIRHEFECSERCRELHAANNGEYQNGCDATKGDFEDMFYRIIKLLEKHGYSKSAGLIRAVADVEDFNPKKADRDMLLAAAKQFET